MAQLSEHQRADSTSQPVSADLTCSHVSMPVAVAGDCYVPALGTSVNLYALAFAAAEVAVARAKQQAVENAFLASCN